MLGSGTKTIFNNMNLQISFMHHYLILYQGHSGLDYAPGFLLENRTKYLSEKR